MQELFLDEEGNERKSNSVVYLNPTFVEALIGDPSTVLGGWIAKQGKVVPAETKPNESEHCFVIRGLSVIENRRATKKEIKVWL